MPLDKSRSPRPFRHRAAALLVTAALAASCAGAGAATTAAPPTTATPTTLPPTTTTTLPPTTTTTVPPTTTTVAAADFFVRFKDGPGELRRAIRKLYRYANREAPSAPSMPAELRATVRKGPKKERLDVTPKLIIRRLPEARVAVATTKKDVILAVSDGSGKWRIVGAHLASLGRKPWFGPDKPRLLMVIGSDARPGQNPPDFRADSLHVVALNPASRSAVVVGIPRDSWVTSASGATGKITDFMANTGPDIIVDTVEQMGGIELEGHLLTGFAGFVSMVDAIGGFMFDVPTAMSDSGSHASFDAGTQRLDGTEALAFARTRKTLPRGDLDRSYNQGLLLITAMLRAQRLGWHGLSQMVEAFGKYGSTDLSAEELVTFAATVYRTNPRKVTNLVLPGSVGWAGTASVVFLGDDSYDILSDLKDGRLRK
jgi:polyisoprenyl-teichoic acid--peptidoglycan teichoic acid transferase